MATITKGQTFQTGETITNTKLHDLIDLSTWELSGQTTGDIAYFNGTAWVRLAVGASGQVLTMNASAAPYWATP